MRVGKKKNMEGLVPTFDMNGNNNGWGSGWGALVGGAVGGAVGSAWGRNGRYDDAPGNSYVMDSLATMPSSMEPTGRIIPEKRLLGLRAYESMPVSPRTVDGLNFNEMVFYIAEPREGTDMQSLLDAVLRVSQTQEKPDTDWVKLVSEEDASNGSQHS